MDFLSEVFYCSLIVPFKEILIKKAIKRNDIKAVKKYINKENPYLTSKKLIVFSSENAKDGDLEILKYLIKNYDISGFAKRLFMYDVCREGHANIIQAFFEGSILLNDYSLIKTASMYGHLNIVKYLMENCDIHNELAEESLIIASEYGHLDVVKYLVSKGTNIHTFQEQPIRMASKNNNQEIIEYLSEISHGVYTEKYNEKYIIYIASLNLVMYGDEECQLEDLNASTIKDFKNNCHVFKRLNDYVKPIFKKYIKKYPNLGNIINPDNIQKSFINIARECELDIFKEFIKLFTEIGEATFLEILLLNNKEINIFLLTNNYLDNIKGDIEGIADILDKKELLEFI